MSSLRCPDVDSLYSLLSRVHVPQPDVDQVPGGQEGLHPGEAGDLWHLWEGRQGYTGLETVIVGDSVRDSVIANLQCLFEKKLIESHRELTGKYLLMNG